MPVAQRGGWWRTRKGWRNAIGILLFFPGVFVVPVISAGCASRYLERIVLSQAYGGARYAAGRPSPSCDYR
jgi:hypothetical protein